MPLVYHESASLSTLKAYIAKLTRRYSHSPLYTDFANDLQCKLKVAEFPKLALEHGSSLI